MEYFWNGFEKRAGLAKTIGKAIGTTKGTFGKATQAIRKVRRGAGLEYRMGVRKGLAETNPAMARLERSKTFPTKAAPVQGSKLKSIGATGAAIGLAGAGGLYLGSKGNEQ